MDIYITNYITNFIFILLISTLYTLIEIEIEGQNGWMENIPTCNIVKVGSKMMTLYHIYMLILFSIIIIFQNQMTFTLNSFLYSTSNVLLVIFLEDTLWFIYNPYFTISKYTKKDIWWHSNQPWIFGLPSDIYKIIILNIVFTYITNNYYIIYSLFGSILFIKSSIYIAPYYHTFYKKTHLCYKSTIDNRID